MVIFTCGWAGFVGVGSGEGRTPEEKAGREVKKSCRRYPYKTLSPGIAWENGAPGRSYFFDGKML
jgi:hypothetical protein